MIKSIRKQLKISFDRIRNERLKTNLLQAIPFWLGSLITGAAVVMYTKLFIYAEDASAYVYQHKAWLFFLLTPVCFIAGWWVVLKVAPYAKGSGIPQVMASIELSTPKNNEKINKLLSLKIILVKLVSSLVLAVGGGVIGKEGPAIHIAGSVFREINNRLPKWWPKISKRNMIMTGAAAGLAAAFNTPLGGIVFAVEELTKTHISYFKTALFTAVIISGLAAQALLGPYLYLGYPDLRHISSWIFFAVIAVAIISGLTAAAMSKIILRIFAWKRTFQSRYQHVLFLTGSALILVILGLFVNQSAFGSGKNIMTSTLFTNAKYLPWYTPFLRITGPILCFTTGAAGGIFAPALGAGASVGSVMAGWFHLSAADSNLLILCGMVGFLTGVTRTPFTSAILVLEMTDRHNVIFHLMFAGMVASIVAILIDKYSLYDHLKHQYLQDISRTEEAAESPEPELKE